MIMVLQNLSTLKTNIKLNIYYRETRLLAGFFSGKVLSFVSLREAQRRGNLVALHDRFAFDEIATASQHTG
jgi:hypothetical protein